VARLRIIWLLALLVLMGIGGGASAIARDVITVKGADDALDLAPIVDRLESAEKFFRVDSAPDGSGEVVEVKVEAQGKGPIFRWIVFSLRNVGRERIDYVLSHPRSGIAGSGLFWPKLTSLQLTQLKASRGTAPSRIDDPSVEAYAFSVEPGETITYAGQIAGQWPTTLRLLSNERFEVEARRWAFAKGLLLGIAIIAAIYISTLVLIRRKLIFPATALLAWSAVALICLDFGYLPTSVAITSNFSGNVRAFIEGFILIGMLSFLLVFLDLRRAFPIVAFAMMFLLLGAALSTALAAFSPPVSAGVSRLMILLTVGAGAALNGYLAGRGSERARALIPTWTFITIWACGAAASVLELIPNAMFSLALDAGLVVIVLLLAVTVTQFAFVSSLLSSGIDLDSDRKSLALAGAEQCVWDLDTERQRFHVGSELERLLRLKPGMMRKADKDTWLNLMHPDDRNGYLSAVRSAIERGNGTFVQEFRLKRTDGSYRWFRLRARAFSGENGKAHRCIGALVDVTGEKRAHTRLLRDAVHDAVTGLPNRALFMDRLEQAVAHAESDSNEQFAVLVIDLDRFKRINDGLGHSVGDGLLMTVARRLRKHLRAYDTLARISGDQFGIVVSYNGTIGQIQQLGERMRMEIGQPVQIKPRDIQMTASIGIADYEPEITAHDLLKNAEVALHNAKRKGKDKVETFEPSMRARSITRYHLEANLKHAVENGEIQVIYQPIARVKDLRIAGFEALVRWAHPKLGMLAPREFIDIAEESGAIVDIGRHVLNEATYQLGLWQRLSEWQEPLFVSVNVSSRQILAQNLVEHVKTALESNQIAPGSLKLEITESLVMANPEASTAVLAELRALGAGLSIDDFGTGYSSLSYLPRFPFDTVKIDSSFIQNAKFDVSTSIILKAITQLAHDLHMTVVAEGVEADKDIDLLREHACEYAQGFYLGQPMPAEAVRRYLGGQGSQWPHVEALSALKDAARTLQLPEGRQAGFETPAVAPVAAEAEGQAPAIEITLPPDHKPAAPAQRPAAKHQQRAPAAAGRQRQAKGATAAQGTRAPVRGIQKERPAASGTANAPSPNTLTRSAMRSRPGPGSAPVIGQPQASAAGRQGDHGAPANVTQTAADGAQQLRGTNAQAFGSGQQRVRPQSGRAAGTPPPTAPLQPQEPADAPAPGNGAEAGTGQRQRPERDVFRPVKSRFGAVKLSVEGKEPASS